MKRLLIDDMSRDELLKFILGNSNRYGEANRLMLESFGDKDLVGVAHLVQNETQQMVHESMMNYW